MRTDANGTKILEPGDRISCQGITCTIATIAYQEYWGKDGFRTEFTEYIAKEAAVLHHRRALRVKHAEELAF